MAVKGKTQLKVGITIASAQDAQALLWANGLSQNIVYLALLLQRLPIVGEVALVCDAPSHAVADGYGLPLWGVEYAAAHCDVVIELGSRSFGAPQVERLRAHGGKIVSFVAGNVMAFNFETLAHGKGAGEILVKHQFDAAWLLPQHWHMCRSYCATVGSPNVHEIPVLWDPVFLNQTAALLRKNIFWRAPESGKYTLGCFDPNINALKTFHFPLLVAEEAYRADKSRIEKLLLFSAMHLKDTRHVTEMILATDIGKDGRISLEERHPLARVMGNYVHAVVTHQWENKCNYLYYEVLYLGWPLIHNAPSLRDAGYYYEQFDPQGGGQVLQEALQGHPEIRVRQRDAIREALWNVSIDNPANQDRYSDLLLQVMG
ncbi:DUF2827 family protein [Caenibius sp. WL]|uniref:DUF2827 family protein n=1 Tax=Caenibius sp. WL TaxID=2872646 RepID=UPI001C994FC2|nr:DUF2827 family protein [Caenibius sp. WL]QZP09437.1 DUF2827 domain-containing protein [Caenibius sp. WL]